VDEADNENNEINYALDKENMKEILDDFPNQIKKGIELAKDKAVKGNIQNIILIGMGGSALAGEILKCYLKYELKIPFMILRNYSLPAFADKRTLIIASSYSGNTEETITAYREAIRKNIPTIAIASGGKLEELSRLNKNPFIKLPKGIQPRLSIGYSFFALLKILENSKIIESKKEDTKKTEKALKKPMFKEMAKKLAKKIKGKIPIIYSSDDLSCVAYKWKIDMNENAKIHAFYNVIPEMNHNELVGYTNLLGNYHVLILKDDEDYDRIKKRIKINKELIKKKDIGLTEVEIRGECFLTKIFSAIYIGDWVSYYLALLYNQDPTPVDIVEELKRNLK